MSLSRTNKALFTPFIYLQNIMSESGRNIPLDVCSNLKIVFAPLKKAIDIGIHG